jgi:hypothetical protein
MQAQAIGGAVSGFSHAALPPPLDMLQPPSRMRLDVLRFHGHLLGLEAQYLIARIYWKMGFIGRLRITEAK